MTIPKIHHQISSFATTTSLQAHTLAACHTCGPQTSANVAPGLSSGPGTLPQHTDIRGQVVLCWGGCPAPVGCPATSWSLPTSPVGPPPHIVTTMSSPGIAEAPLGATQPRRGPGAQTPLSRVS